MIDTVVIATDGSESAVRAVDVALDLAGRFDADVHALYVIDESDVDGSPETLREEMREALAEAGDDALAQVSDRTEKELTTAVKSGKPAREICQYVDTVDADMIATGTRGRHGEHSFLLGSVAEAIVRRCPAPVLTVRQLDEDEQRPDAVPR